mmetsp:Transcript_21088/g.56801  ORF Transcript_21088/g.56801 Transcript_21088/m.56801 type:complete len:318 (-) Transcript_21088:288-1241(-)
MYRGRGTPHSTTQQPAHVQQELRASCSHCHSWTAMCRSAPARRRTRAHVHSRRLLLESAPPRSLCGEGRGLQWSTEVVRPLAELDGLKLSLARGSGLVDPRLGALELAGAHFVRVVGIALRQPRVGRVLALPGEVCEESAAVAHTPLAVCAREGLQERLGHEARLATAREHAVVRLVTPASAVNGCEAQARIHKARPTGRGCWPPIPDDLVWLIRVRLLREGGLPGRDDTHTPRRVAVVAAVCHHLPHEEGEVRAAALWLECTSVSEVVQCSHVEGEGADPGEPIFQGEGALDRLGSHSLARAAVAFDELLGLDSEG